MHPTRRQRLLASTSHTDADHLIVEMTNDDGALQAHRVTICEDIPGTDMRRVGASYTKCLAHRQARDRPFAGARTRGEGAMLRLPHVLALDEDIVSYADDKAMAKLDAVLWSCPPAFGRAPALGPVVN
jgi:hypothetical protein